MRAQEKSDSKQEYDKAGSDKTRLEFLAEFIVNPDVAKCSFRQVTSKEAVDGTRGRRVWLTLNQMASSQYWNSMDDAELVAADCPSRPHSKPSMAKAGKKDGSYSLSNRSVGGEKGRGSPAHARTQSLHVPPEQ